MQPSNNFSSNKFIIYKDDLKKNLEFLEIFFPLKHLPWNFRVVGRPLEQLRDSPFVAVSSPDP